MRARLFCLVAGTIVASLVEVHPATAQAPRPETGTAISLFGGVASASSETGGVIGGAVAFDLDPRTAVEAAGLWFDRGSAIQAYRIGADLIVKLTRPTQPSVPYVIAGIGVYRASIDAPLSPLVAETIPRFYRDRLSAGTASGLGDQRSFTDPVLTVGGGLRIRVNRYVFIRPEAKALVAWADGDTHTLGLIGVSIGFQIEERPVTP